MKLGFKSKGEFQAAHLKEVLEEFFKGGNHSNDVSIESEITSIVNGLSRAWDAAEEYDSKS